MRLRQAVYLSGVLLLASGCRFKGNIWGEVYNFRGNTWSDKDNVTFTPDSAHISKWRCRNIIISVRYGQDFSLKKLPLILEIESPLDRTGYYVDTLNLNMTSRVSRGFKPNEICDTLNLTSDILPGWSISLKPAYEGMDIRDIYSIGVAIPTR